MKEMKVGDQALFYHSNCKEPGVFRAPFHDLVNV